MRSPIPLVWFAVLALLLLPTAAGRVLLDVAGGLILVLLAVPLLLGGVGWIGWRLLQSRMCTCSACGTVNVATNGNCQMCGAELSKTASGPSASSFNSAEDNTVPASDATIDISAETLD
ncbi:MAG: hypothetical protein ACON4T_09030 [Synechococcus sp.]